MKKLFNLTLFLVAISLLFSSCDNSDELIEINSSLKQANFIQRVSKEFYQTNSKLCDKLANFNIKSSSSGGIENRIIFDAENNITIDDETAIYIENGDYHSYTFSIYSDNPEYTENLFLSYDTQNADYVAYVTTYNLTYEERVNSINDIYENEISENLISIEAIDFDESILWRNNPGDRRPIGDGLCGVFDHVTIDPNDPTRLILHYVNISECTAEELSNNQPVIIDIPELSSGNYSAISINYYNSTTGATEEWNADDWEAAGGGTFIIGDGQITYFPTNSTVPVVNKPQEVLNMLSIDSLADPLNVEKSQWVYNEDNIEQVNTIYDYLAANTDKFGTDLNAQNLGNATIEILMRPLLESTQHIDYVNEILRHTNHLKLFGNVEDEIYAEYIESLIPEFDSMTIDEVKRIYSEVKTACNELAHKYLEEIVTILVTDLVLPVITYALLEATAGTAIKLLQRLPVAMMLRGARLNKMVQKLAQLGEAGIQPNVRVIRTASSPVQKAEELFLSITKDRIGPYSYPSPGVTVANMGEGNYITYRTVSGSGFPATIDLNFPAIFGQYAKILKFTL